MNNTLSSQPPPAAPPVDRLSYLIRQVCLLREQGRMLEAARLQESEVAGALRELRRGEEASAPSEADVQAIYAAEERRVAEAAALAELLLPRLLAGLGADARPGALRPVRPARPPAESPAVVPRDGPPAIPDLLDAMLAAERSGRRSAAPVSREP